ncbi:MAG: large subunit ribosomal protein L15 [Parcubacteria group bacterium Gr01-1014_18]|nr:MAG: large subunit ribosomal protein L15 [Parcubacteria group bacterium Greene0416_36]TSC80269.1 MAG: large subunit ribosomal protein L15 [Parcubacteria group bacterium Gr01-1014_18]TSC98248.1 MAG: large subunit ribosomal protein L15 [Parcubacteria group bacterium Greene1014_20]TSD07009.1 MAG: large subunit ribosomal protein L15 [Parcubacteria group bacterium Greene0714_2]
MAITLQAIKIGSGIERPSKRLGRGDGSGKGSYSGRGIKGQGARSGGMRGQYKRAMRENLMHFPKYKGFKTLELHPLVVNLRDIESHFSANALVSPGTLRSGGLVRAARAEIKVLGEGELTKKLIFSSRLVFSSSAIEKIKASGSLIQELKKIKKSKQIRKFRKNQKSKK